MGDMEAKNGNSQVIDLRGEACPMNLVKFKYHFSVFGVNKEDFTVLIEGEGFENIKKFLQFKNVNFAILSEAKGLKINFNIE